MQKKETKYILFGLLGAGFLFFLVSLYVHVQESEYVSLVELRIAKQEAVLIAIAEVTDRDGADAVVSSVLKDCSTEDRQQFDQMLGSLAMLKGAELVKVNQLFSACGNFYAERKAMMVARFVREFEVYQDYVELRTLVDSRTLTITYPVESWLELVGLEQRRSDLFSELVQIQGEIITTLLDNVSIDSERMQKSVVRAQEVKDTISYTGAKIDTLRDAIVGL